MIIHFSIAKVGANNEIFLSIEVKSIEPIILSKAKLSFKYCNITKVLSGIHRLTVELLLEEALNLKRQSGRMLQKCGNKRRSNTWIKFIIGIFLKLKKRENISIRTDYKMYRKYQY